MLFETKSKADSFIRFNAEEIRKKNGYAPIRSYYCYACLGWHLTHRELLPKTEMPISAEKYVPLMFANPQVRVYMLGKIMDELEKIVNDLLKSLDCAGMRWFSEQYERAILLLQEIESVPGKKIRKKKRKAIYENINRIDKYNHGLTA
ncbi:MAG: hypothetical protein MJZ76_08985 [Bacteroidales bacterium]|nr:hypothetical protein [Bacteroidales bacterium]